MTDQPICYPAGPSVSAEQQDLRERIAQLISDDFTQTYLGNSSVFDTADAILELIKGAVPVWQPMETAPKDGTRILVQAERVGWEGHPRIVGVAWDSSGTGAWAQYGCGATKWSEQWLDRGLIPTKWMHLPPVPASSQQ